MRAIKFILFSTILFLCSTSEAQVSIHFEFGTPPPWGPTGYGESRYYYLPDIESYYDVQSSVFICFNGRQWIRRAHLPYRYRNYDLYRGYKVVMSDYRGNAPYSHFREHRVKYGKEYRDHYQQTYHDKSINNKKDRDNHQNLSNRNEKKGGEEKGKEGKNRNKGRGHDKND